MSSVLITGANRGIGRAIATEFARRGHRVVATARDPGTLADLDASQRLALDVTDDASVTAAVAAAGDIDIVIANAGVIFYAAVEAIPLDELLRLFNLNTIGAIRVAQAVLPQMRERGAPYASTKWALEALVEALAIEVSLFGVQAALLEPGAVSSGALDDVTTYTLPDDPYTAILKGGGPRAGIITPEQVAAEVVDTAEKPQLPLRIPIGDAARALLAARHTAPDDVPFIPAN
jgi:NADP-dependent 3-hydroxy acid dehydrogenase YdfG